jgi:hypothetical protein
MRAGDRILLPRCIHGREANVQGDARGGIAPYPRLCICGILARVVSSAEGICRSIADGRLAIRIALRRRVSPRGRIEPGHPRSRGLVNASPLGLMPGFESGNSRGGGGQRLSSARIQEWHRGGLCGGGGDRSYDGTMRSSSPPVVLPA